MPLICCHPPATIYNIQRPEGTPDSSPPPTTLAAPLPSPLFFFFMWT